jgi:hypothetical protein
MHTGVPRIDLLAYYILEAHGQGKGARDTVKGEETGLQELVWPCQARPLTARSDSIIIIIKIWNARKNEENDVVADLRRGYEDVTSSSLRFSRD